MPPRDDLPVAVRSLLTELARERGDELIREAEAEARAAVKARLREGLEEAYMRELGGRVDAPPPAAPSTAAPAPDSSGEPDPAPERSPDPEPDGHGLWVYCVAGGEFAGLDADVGGVADWHAPRAIRAAGLVAVVSEVPLAQFGEQPLKRNLNDLAWVESVARAHERVLEAALSAGPIVPMRVCTIFRGHEQVRQMLVERGAAFADALGWLDGRAEWGVKVIADRDRVAAIAGERASATESGSPAGAAGEGGGAYLGRKQQTRYLRELVDTIVEEAVRECHARLEEWAAASELLRPQSRELAGYDGEMVFNGAYLVDDERREAFARVTEELRRQYGEAGLTFELTGPWPAFHFVGRLQSVEEPVS
jgi:hypothetical protein